MRRSTLILILAWTFNTWGAASAPPLAKLTIHHSDKSVGEVNGQVTESPLTADQSSCDIIHRRLDTLNRQSEELHRLAATLVDSHGRINTETQRLIEELQKAKLRLDNELREPWMQTRAVFEAPSIPAPESARILAHDFTLSYDLEGVAWSSAQGLVPPGVDVERQGTVTTLTFVQNALEYCYPNGDISVDFWF